MVMREKRPWCRPRNVVLGTLVLVALFLGSKGFDLVTARPVVSVNYAKKISEVVEANQSPAPDAADTWPAYVKAVELAAEVGKEVRGQAPSLEEFVVPDYGLVYAPPAAPAGPAPGTDPGLAAAEAQEAAQTAARAATAREWTLKCLPLMRERGVYTELAKLKGATRFVRPVNGEASLLAVQFTELKDVRDLARALGARMHEAGRAGDDADMVEAFEESLAMARVLGHQGTLIERLVSTATSSLAMSRAREEAMRRPLDAATCRAMLAAMDRQCVLPPMSLPMKTERLFFLDVVQRTHSDDGHGNGYRLPREMDSLGIQGPDAAGNPRPVRPRIANLTGVFYPSRAALVAKGDQIYDALAKAADAPRSQRTSLDSTVDQLPQTYDLLKLLVPAMGSALQAHDRHTLEIAGTRTMLAIEAFRAEKGHLPATLDDLVPGVLAALSTDPFAPDGRLRYRPLAAPDELGRTYLLYSVGADGVDDGGVEDPKDNILGLHGTGTGKDYIINTRQRPQQR